jgi:hypothetical protein
VQVCVQHNNRECQDVGNVRIGEVTVLFVVVVKRMRELLQYAVDLLGFSWQPERFQEKAERLQSVYGGGR